MKPTPFLPDPKMPLRDMFRGAASLADGTHQALEPAARMLPKLLRDELSTAFQSIRSTGKRLVMTPVSLEQIALAGRVVQGLAQDPAAAATCATVIGRAWHHLSHAPDGKTHHHLLSETLLTAQLAQLPKGVATPADHAAQLVRRVLDGGAIGAAPGLFIPLGAEEKAEISLSLLAITVWLLSERCDSLDEEDRLVDLAAALVLATRDDALEAMRGETTLSAYLARASDHL
ncbi:hypothetical protein [Frigidibacter sp. ROC022]|uniref:hypothetical protein n=1 Tax=Frigidibacter sp. ROC022 TaxID=2971796 RepID=UPI00215A3B4E|nr:hypothetical protein [Frigidibacter sp. ROC022]MCR8722767.1 hypothetical protein [Frigidibacter sp. ROC022]